MNALRSSYFNTAALISRLHGSLGNWFSASRSKKSLACFVALAVLLAAVEARAGTIYVEVNTHFGEEDGEFRQRQEEFTFVSGSGTSFTYPLELSDTSEAGASATGFGAVDV